MAKILKESAYTILYDGVREFSRHRHIEIAHICDGALPADHPLQNENCDLAECEKYFKPVAPNSIEIKDAFLQALQEVMKVDPDSKPEVEVRSVAPGMRFRHFKGKIVEVLAVPQDTEFPGHWYVVYTCADGRCWSRPLDMFLSEVDHEKYPDVEQKYRFEQLNGGGTDG